MGHANYAYRNRALCFLFNRVLDALAKKQKVNFASGNIPNYNRNMARYLQHLNGANILYQFLELQTQWNGAGWPH